MQESILLLTQKLWDQYSLKITPTDVFLFYINVNDAVLQIASIRVHFPQIRIELQMSMYQIQVCFCLYGTFLLLTQFSSISNQRTLGIWTDIWICQNSCASEAQNQPAGLLIDVLVLPQYQLPNSCVPLLCLPWRTSEWRTCVFRIICAQRPLSGSLLSVWTF